LKDIREYNYLYVNGDSYTFGLDLEIHLKDRWSKILSEKLNCIEINESINGGSNDRMIRKFFEWTLKNKNKLKDTFVILGWTVPYRYEIFYEGKWTPRKVGDYYEDVLTRVGEIECDYFHDEVLKRKFIEQIILVQNFLKLKNINYTFFVVVDDGVCTEIEYLKKYPYVDFDRFMDISFDEFSGNVWGKRHPNIKDHFEWSNKLYGKIR
jgi:hypothetical protein|tara:strand:- start:485 stop:1111 length:627 start_codon:yes stop_codon:yes gene_type:complete